MSRRAFLALSAAVVTGCNGDGDDASDGASGSTTPPGTDPASTSTAGADPARPTTSAPPTAPPAVATTSPPDDPGPPLAADPFLLGVASGDPDATSVVLWTRLVGELPPDDVDVAWELVDTAGAVVTSGRTRAVAEQGHSVHVVVDVDTPVRYRFRAGGWTSPIGDAQPAAARAELRVAAASCQHFETGFYAAHRDIAEWAPDLVVFLGDFIYEGAGQPAGQDGRVRSHAGDEPTVLTAYRDRYAQYLSDADLRASRAACPWLMIWDDHEVENNYAGLEAQEIADESAFAERRQQAYRAWWEHMPTRLDPPALDGPGLQIHRGVDYGDLVAISALDGRQYRSDQACGSPVLDTGPPCADALDPVRTMLGDEQEAWLAGRFSATGATWNVVVQQTVMTDLRLENGAILNYDQWDGYAPARDRVLAGAPEGLVVLSGDIHFAGVGRLGTRGVEFVTPSISSRGNVDPALQPLLASFDDVVDAELVHRGYTRHTVTANEWAAEYRAVDDATDPSSRVSTWKTFRVAAGTVDVVADPAS
jgi:alkaline phosphatase D